MVTSPPLLAEFARVLSDKFGWEVAMVDQAVAQVARLAIVVRPKKTLIEIAEDPDDDRVLEAALESGADSIVSGDGHLLRLRSWRGVAIEKPAAFLARFEHSS